MRALVCARLPFETAQHSASPRASEAFAAGGSKKDTRLLGVHQGELEGTPAKVLES